VEEKEADALEVAEKKAQEGKAQEKAEKGKKQVKIQNLSVEISEHSFSSS
jgi:hypothetical protein